MQIGEKLQSAMALHRQGRVQEALDIYTSILEETPLNGDALHAKGVLLYTIGRYEEAEKCLKLGAEVLEKRGEAYSHWGAALQRLGRAEESLFAHERALELDPSSAVILNNYGNALIDVGRANDALHIFRRSLDAQPNSSGAWTNYSLALKGAGELILALDAARRSVALEPNFVSGLVNLGMILTALGKADEAVEVLAAATVSKETTPSLWSNLIYALQYSDRSSLELIRESTEGFARSLSGLDSLSFSFSIKPTLRIGFVSADLRQHAVARFLRPLLRERGDYPIEVYLYSDTIVEDKWSEEFKMLCEKWTCIVGRSDLEVASLVQADDVDLLIDLAGHSGSNRLPLFAMKPAPWQATWLGFPGSTGLRTIDFRISDAVILKEEESSLFPERPLLLEEGCHSIAFDEVPDVVDSPSSKGSPFAFGSFNNLSKISAQTIRLWSEILCKTPDAILVLKSYQLLDPECREDLLERFALAGVGRQRIRLLEPEPNYESHLDCYAQVDLCLDTFPYNGTTTTCEALYMGVPVLTLVGDRSCARVSASLLTTIGLDAFVCEDEGEYVESAVAWACEGDELNVLRHRLRSEFLNSSLGNASRFAKTFYSAVWDATMGSLQEKAPFVEGGGWLEQMSRFGFRTDGTVTYPYAGILDAYLMPGMTFLDASAVDGFWAIAALRAGAASAMAIPAEGLLGEDMKASRGSYFARAMALANVEAGSADLCDLQVYHLDPEAHGRFDLVVLFVNGNRIRHLLFALDSIRSVCRGRLLIQLEWAEEDGSACFQMEEGAIIYPSKRGMERMALEAGFQIERWLEFETPAGSKESVLVLRTDEMEAVDEA